MDFEGKTTLITGAGNGIGKSAAIRFAEGGANVILVDINIDAVTETQKEIAHLGKEHLAIRALPHVGDFDIDPFDGSLF